MAQRAYVIVLETNDEPVADQWTWFEDCVKQSVLDTWDNCGYSDMGDVDLDNLGAPAVVTAVAQLTFALQSKIEDMKEEL